VLGPPVVVDFLLLSARLNVREEPAMAKETRYNAYDDGMKTDHHMEGTVIPKAASRGYWDSKTLPQIKADTVGADIDVQQPLAQNLVEVMEDGSVRTVHLTQEDVKKLVEANRVKGKDVLSDHPPVAITYDQIMPPKPLPGTVKMAEPAQPIQPAQPSIPVFRTMPIDQIPPMAVPPDVAAYAATGSLVPPVPGYTQPKPRKKIQFVGEFGSITYHYEDVHIYNIYFIMVQHSREREFFEAPSGEKPVVINFGSARYICYPGPQFPLIPNGELFVTVYLIDEEATSQLNGQRGNDGKA
jgi:hypothetical protein